LNIGIIPVTWRKLLLVPINALSQSDIYGSPPLCHAHWHDHSFTHLLTCLPSGAPTTHMLNGLQNRVLSPPETFPARRLSPSQRGIATRAALQTGRAYAKPLLPASSKAL